MADMPTSVDPLTAAIEQMKREAYAAGWKAAIEAVGYAIAAAAPPEAGDVTERIVFSSPATQKQAAADSGVLTVGTTPHYVYEAVRRKQGMTGAEVIEAVRADGHNAAEPQIRTTLSRLEKRQLLANRHRKWFLK